MKLPAALPAGTRDRAARIRERFHLDAPGWFHDGVSPPHLAEVADAVWRQRTIEVVYRRWGPEEVERTLDPLGLVLKAGSWYLVGRSPGTARTYRISRILELRVTEDAFERPEGFDLAAFWEARAEMVLPFRTVQEAHGDLLRPGAEVEVLRPLELRKLPTHPPRPLAALYGQCGTRQGSPVR